MSFESSGFLNTDLNAIRALYTIGTPISVPIYNKDGGVTALIERAVAVHANSENMDNVRKFLEILFEKQIMEQPGGVARKYQRAKKCDGKGVRILSDRMPF